VFVLGAGCATPASRIKRAPDKFAAFPPQVQENVRKGEIAIGYTRDMVFIALGAPHRVYDRTTAAGEAETWAYTGVRYSTRFRPVDATYTYRGADGRLHWGHNWAWVDVSDRDEYETLRVVFENEKVATIERLRR